MNQQLDLFDNKLFSQYHEENPQVYKAFKEMALKAVTFKSHFGAKAIFEVLRWKTAVSGNDGFKINNNYTSFYARMFENEFPQHKDFFRKRKSKFD